MLHERVGLPGLASVLSRSHLVCYLAECGDFIEGRVLAEEGGRIAEAADHPYSRIMAYWVMGSPTLCQGDLHQALAVLERGLDLAQEAHIQVGALWIAALLGAAYVLDERIIQALPLLEQAVAMRFMFDQPLRMVWLGEAMASVGLPFDGLRRTPGSDRGNTSTGIPLAVRRLPPGGTPHT